MVTAALFNILNTTTVLFNIQAAGIQLNHIAIFRDYRNQAGASATTATPEKRPYGLFH